MKKLFTLLFAGGLIFSTASPLIAGGIDNKHNFSAEYIRTLNRNAATDSADAVAYNPAGVVKMEDGLYVSLSGQYVSKEYCHTVSGTDYKDDTPALIPSLFGLYKQDRWAALAAFTIPAGGGTVKYEKGSATTLALGEGFKAGANQQLALIGLPPLYDTVKNQRLEAESIYYGFTVGGAYAVNDMVSVSLGARFIDAQKESKGSVAIGASSGLVPDQSADLDYEETADGWGGIVGVNIAPTRELNIGLRYETKTSLDFETKVNKADLPVVTDGAKARRDLPGLLGLGLAYTVLPNVKLDASFTYYLNDRADWNGAEENVDNGYDIGIALEYTFSPQLKGTLGYLYTETGIDADYMTPEDPQLDAHGVGAGVGYEPIPDLNLNLGLAKTFYLEETTSTGVKYNKEVMVLAFGIQYKF